MHNIFFVGGKIEYTSNFHTNTCGIDGLERQYVHTHIRTHFYVSPQKNDSKNIMLHHGWKIWNHNLCIWSCFYKNSYEDLMRFTRCEVGQETEREIEREIRNRERVCVCVK